MSYMHLCFNVYCAHTDMWCVHCMLTVVCIHFTDNLFKSILLNNHMTCYAKLAMIPFKYVGKFETYLKLFKIIC